MITRVLNEKNEVLHDCAEIGCSVSWDGYALKDIQPVAGIIPTLIKAGTQVANAASGDPRKWDMGTTTAKLKVST